MGRIKPKSVPAEASSIETFEPGGQNAVCFFRVSHSLKRFLSLLHQKERCQAGQSKFCSPVPWVDRNSTAHDNTVAARAGGGDVLLLRIGRARRPIIAAAGATAVEANALALAGDAVARARAVGAVRSRGAVARDGR